MLKNKNPLKINDLQGICGTQTRGRTGMEVNPLVFETSASTDSAIWALVSNAVQRYGFFLNLQEFYKKKEKKRIKDRINTSIFRE